MSLFVLRVTGYGAAPVYPRTTPARDDNNRPMLDRIPWTRDVCEAVKFSSPSGAEIWRDGQRGKVEFGVLETASVELLTKADAWEAPKVEILPSLWLAREQPGDMPATEAVHAKLLASSFGKPLAIDYTNWRGERSTRRIVPRRLYRGSNEWHPETQSLLDATDLGKNEVRTFAVAGIHGIVVEAKGEAASATSAAPSAPPRYVLESWVGGAWQRSVHYPDTYSRDEAERIAKVRSGYRAVPETNGEADTQ